MQSQIINSNTGSSAKPEQGKLYIEANEASYNSTIYLCTDEGTFVVVYSDTFAKGGTRSVANPIPWKGTLQLTQD